VDCPSNKSCALAVKNLVVKDQGLTARGQADKGHKPTGYFPNARSCEEGQMGQDTQNPTSTAMILINTCHTSAAMTPTWQGHGAAARSRGGSNPKWATKVPFASRHKQTKADLINRKFGSKSQDQRMLNPEAKRKILSMSCQTPTRTDQVA